MHCCRWEFALLRFLCQPSLLNKFFDFKQHLEDPTITFCFNFCFQNLFCHKSKLLVSNTRFLFLVLIYDFQTVFTSNIKWNNIFLKIYSFRFSLLSKFSRSILAFCKNKQKNYFNKSPTAWVGGIVVLVSLSNPLKINFIVHDLEKLTICYFW